MIENLILYQKVYDLILYSFPIINRFPKTQKYVLGQQIENTLLNLLKAIITANNKKAKLNYLFYADTELQTLKTLIRLAKDLKFIDLKRYHVFSIKTTEIGKILGGWINKNKKG